jgi:hypothetical protein
MTASAVQVLTYPVQALLGDYVRAGIGVVLTAGPLFVIPSDSYAVWVLGALALLFLAFALRTAWRHASRIEFDDERISLFGPGQASFLWDALAAVKLSYYATTSDRQGGWMQLTLRGAGGGTIRIDSTVDGFADVARRAARAAHDLGLGLSATTTSNFQAMGIAVGLAGDTAPPAAAFNRTRQ